MNATNAFFIWFFTGLNGLGGWFIFLLFALAGVIWMFYDSANRRLKALGWRMGAVLLALLLVPAMIFRFSSAETQLSLDPFVETIFYLGLLGGILPVVLAIGYYVTYRGLTGCANGHVYDVALGSCPECVAHQAPAQAPVITPQQPYIPAQQRRPEPSAEPLQPIKPKANAWLVSRDGKNYQLCQGETTIGRAPSNDIQFSGDTTVSRQHAKILEKNAHFHLVDLASTSGTKINGRTVRQPTMLEPDDEIQIGDNVMVRFVTSRR